MGSKIIARVNLKHSLLANEEGFTLIEMLVVAIIFLAVIIGMESLQLYSINQIQHSDDRGTAAMIAQDYIEWLRVMDYSTIQTGFTTVYDQAYAPNGIGELYAKNAKLRGRGTTAFYVSWKVDNINADTKKVVLVVRWYEAGATNDSFNPLQPDPTLSLPRGVRQLIASTVIRDLG